MQSKNETENVSNDVLKYLLSPPEKKALMINEYMAALVGFAEGTTTNGVLKIMTEN